MNKHQRQGVSKAEYTQHVIAQYARLEDQDPAFIERNLPDRYRAEIADCYDNNVSVDAAAASLA